MPDDMEKSAIEKMCEWYEANVLMRLGAVALAIPTHGASSLFDVAVTSGLVYLRRKRIENFRDELITLNFQPSEEEVRSEKFIQAFSRNCG